MYIEKTIADNLPAMVKNELKSFSAQKQEEFVEEYKRKSKSIGIGYLLLILVFGLHYGYCNKWGLQVVYWLTMAGLGWWFIIDLFRIPSIVKNYNKDIATEVMRNLKSISG